MLRVCCFKRVATALPTIVPIMQFFMLCGRSWYGNFDSSKHSGIIAEFRRRYIKAGIFPVEISKMIGSAFSIRNASDYDDMFVASRSDTEEQIQNAEYIYQILSEFVLPKIDSGLREE